MTEHKLGAASIPSAESVRGLTLISDVPPRHSHRLPRSRRRGPWRRTLTPVPCPLHLLPLPFCPISFCLCPVSCLSAGRCCVCLRWSLRGLRFIWTDKIDHKGPDSVHLQ